ncbi:MAG: glycosyltransferase family 9 protein, partial [Planctomycetota bacterium]
MTWTPTPLLPNPPRSVLIVMLSAVGDAVQVLPVATALRRAFPETRIAWAVQPAPGNLVQGHPAIDDFILFPKNLHGKSPGSILQGLKSLTRTTQVLREFAAGHLDGSFDVLLDLQVYLKAGLLTALSPARIKLGFDRHRARDLNWLFTNRKIPPHPQGLGHIQDQYLEFLAPLGVDPEPLEFGLALTEEETEDQRRFFSSFDRPACAMVVGTSKDEKNWTPEGFAEVARVLYSDLGLQPVLVGGRSPAEESIAQGILACGGDKVADARGGDLRHLLKLLCGSAVVISPDTGPMHMARALEVPVVSLFGYTNPKRYGPYRLFTEL